MPASRWQTNLNDLLQWNEDEENELLSLIMPSMFSKFQKKDSSSAESDSAQMSNSSKYPDILPILPLRGVVVYPQTAVPLTVGQPRSIKLVDEVVGGDKLAYRDAERKRLTPLGWVLVAIFAAAAALCYWWFKQQFAALGYAS